MRNASREHDGGARQVCLVARQHEDGNGTAGVADNCKRFFTPAKSNSSANVSDIKLIDGVETGTLEFKASRASAVDGLPQAYDTAVMALDYKKFPLEDVVVPFSTHTASEELHGIVYLLKGAAPCFAVLAIKINRLDMTHGGLRGEGEEKEDGLQVTLPGLLAAAIDLELDRD